jgi:hypothetical protein
MILEVAPVYPASRSYVLSLHREAGSNRLLLRGRLENMALGRHFYFNTGDELLACLVADLAFVLAQEEAKP